MDTLDIFVESGIIFSMAYQAVKTYSIYRKIKQNKAYGVLKRNQKTKELYIEPEELPSCILPFPLDVAYIAALESIQKNSEQSLEFLSKL